MFHLTDPFVREAWSTIGMVGSLTYFFKRVSGKSYRRCATREVSSCPMSVEQGLHRLSGPKIRLSRPVWRRTCPSQIES